MGSYEIRLLDTEMPHLLQGSVNLNSTARGVQFSALILENGIDIWFS